MSVKNCFNKAAENYDQHCHLQIVTGEKLLSLIEYADQVIDLGCGSGLITEKLKYKQLYALDLSNKMLKIARQRLGNNNITYLETSFNNVKDLKLDLAFANMSLQWSDNLQETFQIIKANLNPEGILAFSIPIKGTFIDLDIPTIQFIEFEQIKKLLEGWQIVHAFSEEYNYLFPNLIKALKSIKAVGANYYNSCKKSIITRDTHPKTLKYNIGYFIARNYA